MNETVNKSLLAGDKFMPEMYLKHYGPFNKNKDRVQKFKETGDSKYIYKNELDKACFQRDMAYRDFKYLSKRTASDRVLRNKAFNIAKYPKYDGYQRGITPIFDKKNFTSILDKKTPLVLVLIIKLNRISNWLKNYTNQLLEHLKKEKYIHHLKTIFGVLILQICN